MRVVFFSLICCLWCSVQLLAQPTSASDLLNKSIAYHDPAQQWEEWSGTFSVLQETPEKPVSTTKIQMNNATSTFETTSEKNGVVVLRKVAGDSCTYQVNGSTTFSEAQKEKHKLNCERNKLFRNYYTYLYGLPMKLKDPGTIIDPKVRDDQFQGKKCWSIKVTYEATVGEDIWYFYFAQTNYALIGYRFYHEEEKQDGEYILLAQEEEVNGIKMPKIRKWYMNKDDKFLGTDILQKNSK